MPDDFPSFPSMYEAPDAERMDALALQASLPSDYTSPADALGDEAWAELERRDMVEGTDSLSQFRLEWDWNMTPAQRADALANVALQREMAAFVDRASDLAVKPPVDPVEYAGRVREARAARARRM